MSGLCYLDASACVKLAAAETETMALLEYLAGRPDQVSSVVVEVEVARAAARHGPVAGQSADRLLDTLTLVPLTAQIRQAARSIPPASLRTLDAIHLATAVSLGTDLGAFVAYDLRLLAAATEAGLPVASPA